MQIGCDNWRGKMQIGCDEWRGKMQIDSMFTMNMELKAHRTMQKVTFSVQHKTQNEERTCIPEQPYVFPARRKASLWFRLQLPPSSIFVAVVVVVVDPQISISLMTNCSKSNRRQIPRIFSPESKNLIFDVFSILFFFQKIIRLTYKHPAHTDSSIRSAEPQLSQLSVNL